MRVGIDVVQPHPRAELAQRLRQLEKARFQRLAFPRALGVLDVETVGAGVLTDDEQLLDAGFHEAFGLEHDVCGRAARQATPQRGNDAERAAIVAAFGDFQIGVVPGCQMQPFRRHEIEERIVQGWQRVVDGLHHRLVLVGTRDREHAGVCGADAALLDAETTRDDDAAVGGDGLSDGVQAFLLSRVEKPAGVHQHHVGAGIVGDELIALRPQARDDAFAVDQRLGAPERNDTDFWRGLGGGADRAHRRRRLLPRRGGFRACFLHRGRCSGEARRAQRWWWEGAGRPHRRAQ